MIICLCVGITESDIQKCIDGGADTVLKVGKKTGAGMICRACRQTILEMVEKTHGEEDSICETEG